MTRLIDLWRNRATLSSEREMRLRHCASMLAIAVLCLLGLAVFETGLTRHTETSAGLSETTAAIDAAEGAAAILERAAAGERPRDADRSALIEAALALRRVALAGDEATGGGADGAAEPSAIGAAVPVLLAASAATGENRNAAEAAAALAVLHDRTLPALLSARSALIHAHDRQDRVMSSAGWIIIGVFFLFLAGLYHYLLRPMQRSLALAADELRELFSVAGQGLLVMDAAGVCVRHNPRLSALMRTLGCPSVRGRAIGELVAELAARGEIRLTNGDRVDRVFEGDDLRRLDNAIYRGRTGETIAIAVVERQCGGHVASFADITPQRRLAERLHEAERAVAESESRATELALIAEQTQEHLVLTDACGRALWANPAFLDANGYALDAILGRSIEIQFGPMTDPETAERVLDAFSAAAPFTCEMTLYRADRANYWAEVAVTPILDPDGEVRRYICVQRDITRRRQIQEQLAESEAQAIDFASRSEAANRAKSVFLASMSHEIRTPMNGIVGMADLLVRTPLSTEQRLFAETIRRSGDALLVIINDILDFSKIEAGQLSLERAPFDLASVIDEVLTLVSPRAVDKGLALAQAYDRVIPRGFLGDAGRIRQILLNLVGNAVKFTDHGGVDVSVRGMAQAGAAIVEIEVMDSGVGIPADVLPTIFSEFVQVDQSATRRFQGTGLGLAITERLVRLMDGDIWVESTPGVGTTFHVRLPLEVALPSGVGTARVARPDDGTEAARDEAALPDVVARIGRAPDAAMPGTPDDGLPAEADAALPRILVAEDNPTNRLVLEKMLAGSPYAPVFAENGRIAVELYERVRPDVVLMDIAMPELDGFEAVAVIRELERANGLAPVRIIALTANALDSDRERCLAAGMDDHLAKPIRRAVLLDALEAAIGRAARQGEVPAGPPLRVFGSM